MFRSSSRNPMFRESAMAKVDAFASQGIMTMEGFVNKCGILFACLVFSFAWIWNNPHMSGLMWPALIIGFIAAIVTSFKPSIAMISAPIYALSEGILLGAISRMYEAQYSGLVMQAIMLTFTVFAVMLFLYRSGMIKVTDKFRMVIFAATGGIALLYVISLIVGLFGGSIPFIFSAGPIGIGFSLLVVGIAAFSLMIDFDFIQRTVGSAPKQMEWYGAFALLVTLVWLYLEILRLLSKLNRR